MARCSGAGSKRWGYLTTRSRLRSPWQTPYAKRLIGSIRRECPDHLVVMGPAHLRRVLQSYVAYYNQARTHRSLNKDCPIHRLIQAVGTIIAEPILGGLHHRYGRT